jgi:hypothetical protein
MTDCEKDGVFTLLSLKGVTRPEAKAKENRFSSIVGFFFFPLLKPYDE